jgi:serine-type D-Ala-D-Ala carboxypeptidase/endopeptidase (penicillin-binding protein 4)
MLFADGSGLSRFNLSSPAQQTKLLAYVAKKDYKNYFDRSLPTPNGEGSLKKRMVKTKAEKTLQAKTGSMNGVSCLSGYIRTADGENLAFSIMINNFTAPANLAKNLEDMICMRLSSFTRKGE